MKHTKEVLKTIENAMKPGNGSGLMIPVFIVMLVVALVKDAALGVYGLFVKKKPVNYVEKRKD